MSHKWILETPRTRLRELEREDLDSLLPILGDIQVMYAWEHAFTSEEVGEWIGKNLDRYQGDGYSYWAVILKETGLLAGVCGLLAEEAEGEEHLGVGYIFRRDQWHRGYALECASACEIYARDVLGAGGLTAQIRPDNTASRKVAEHLGMKVQREFDRIYRGKAMPHLLYQKSLERNR